MFSLEDRRTTVCCRQMNIYAFAFRVLPASVFRYTRTSNIIKYLYYIILAI